MIQFLLTQIAKLKSAVSTTSNNMVSHIDYGSTTALASLDDIQSYSMGVVRLKSDISPSGTEQNFVYMKPYGSMIMATAPATGSTWIATKTSGAWLAWKKIQYTS